MSTPAAEEHFTRVVREGQVPDEVPEIDHAEPVVHLPQLLAERFGQSTSHWRRMIDQGGVKADGHAVTSYDLETKALDGAVIQAGKRQFLRIRAADGGPPVAIIPGLLVRAAGKDVPVTRPGAPSDANGYD